MADWFGLLFGMLIGLLIGFFAILWAWDESEIKELLDKSGDLK